jgi:hypothetical protein
MASSGSVLFSEEELLYLQDDADESTDAKLEKMESDVVFSRWKLLQLRQQLQTLRPRNSAALPLEQISNITKQISKGSLESFEKGVLQGLDVDGLSDTGWPILTLCARATTDALPKTLIALAAGASPNVCGGETIIQYVTQYGDPHAIPALIAGGADLSAPLLTHNPHAVASTVFSQSRPFPLLPFLTQHGLSTSLRALDTRKHMLHQLILDLNMNLRQKKEGHSLVHPLAPPVSDTTPPAGTGVDVKARVLAFVVRVANMAPHEWRLDGYLNNKVVDETRRAIREGAWDRRKLAVCLHSCMW